MSMHEGKAWCFGDDVDTDQIIPAQFLVTTDPEELGRGAFAAVRPGWAAAVEAGDLIVAGENFGCGSSREHAPISLRGAGVKAVIAKSFARIFYRNAINTGLHIFECPEVVDAIAEGDRLAVDLEQGTLQVGTRTYAAAPLGEAAEEIIAAGGLMALVAQGMKGQVDE